jgi:hypothetical protein
MGKERSDKLVYVAWMELSKQKTKDAKGYFFFNALINADKALTGGQNIGLITEVFKNRGMFK